MPDSTVREDRRRAGDRGDGNLSVAAEIGRHRQRTTAQENQGERDHAGRRAEKRMVFHGYRTQGDKSFTEMVRRNSPGIQSFLAMSPIAPANASSPLPQSIASPALEPLS